MLVLNQNHHIMENPAIIYLYLYLAIADKDFSEMEVSLILSKLRKVPGLKGMDTAQFVKDAYENFKRLPFDSIQVYLENYMAEATLSEGERIALIHDLEEIMEADGVVRKEELIAFQRIKRFLTPGFGIQPFRASA
jgi:uncharacterized tellurite resistance protein B-like protein